MITIIGDVHGKFGEYYKIASNHEYTVQLGDFGFSSAWNLLGYSDLSPDNHKVLGGNHEDYDCCIHSTHYLGDFGPRTLNEIPYFVVRGGLSIDRVYRVGEELSGGPKTWWSQEELNFIEMGNAMDSYRQAKPDIVISHAGPAFLIDRLIKGDLTNYKFHKEFRENTSLLFNRLFSIYRPKVWVFGHYHINFDEVIDGTRFVCLAELQTVQLSANESE
jgi:hypothetical protein